MCKNFRKTSLVEVIGYKIVVADLFEPERYRSIYTDRLYPLNGYIKPAIHQRTFKIPQFLPEDAETQKQWIKANKRRGYWTPQMVGRTAVYENPEHATGQLSLIYLIEGEARLVVVKCRLTKDLLQADWNGQKVYCGRRLQILEEYESPYLGCVG